MSHRRLAIWLVLLSGTVLVPTSRLSARPTMASPAIVVTTSAELLDALSANAGEPIYLQRGTYLLAQAIQVPDNTALIGEGEILFDDSGLPSGFLPETRTVIAALPGVTGNFVTLGDGASLHGLVIQDIARPAVTGGSVVAVSSRMPSDSVSARVTACEIINPNPVTGPGLNGPVGRGILAQTRNRLTAAGAVPHEQSLVSVHLTQSIIRSPGGGDGIFAINFASGSHIELHLLRNVVGKLGANGGISRVDSTVGATTSILSTGNLYRVDNFTATSIGWQLSGGGDAPMLAPLVAEATFGNRLSMHSVDDRLDGFARAITVTGAQRMSAQAGPIFSNQMDLILEGTRLASVTSDFQLFGARNLPGPADGNELRVTMFNVTGSGQRANEYLNMSGTLGTGNRLIINGNVNAFSRTNEAILPLPGPGFFTGGGETGMFARLWIK